MPTPAPDAARRHYLNQKGLAAAAVGRMRAAWQRIDIADLDASWRAERSRMLALMIGGQTLAASQADPYLTAVLAEQGIDTARAASVAATAFAGTASDGRSLQTLLYEPVITTKLALATQRGAAESFAAGEAALMRIAATQVQDAGRTAVAVGIAARPAVTSYTRMLVPPSCSRCVILAGKVYRWNTGFNRHPHCDCQHIPSIENVADDFTTDPGAYFRKLSSAEQDRYFTKDGAESIRSGADISQVVNARRGMYQADGQLLTRTGTSKRALAGKRLKGAARMMPESILARAGDDRELAIELLRQHGYVL